MNKFFALFRGAVRFAMGCAMFASVAHAEISVHDDAGRALTLHAPARRIVSLAPHVTELLFAAGAENNIVGVVEYSDYPEAARRIPRIGSGAGLDLEAIVALRPDLIVAWQSGNPTWQVERLIKLGFPVFVTEPRRIGDVADTLERFGTLTGMEAISSKAAAEFRRHQNQLHARYSGRPSVPVFYQILDSTLLTVNRRHLISDVVQLCGGKNVFADLPGLTPRVDVESVLQKNPEAILASGDGPLWPVWRDRWKIWPVLYAVAHDNLFLIPPDLIHRHSPRILAGAEQVCVALEQVRARRRVAENR